MTRSDIQNRLAAQRERLAALGVKSLRLFGSFSRDQGREDSDIDFLVAFEGRATFDRYAELKILLEDLFGRQIDLVTEAAVRPELKSAIEREALRVA